MSASSAIEGLIGELGIGGTMIAFLTGIEFSGDRAQTPWRAMGSYDPTQILLGRRNYEGAARKAYLCGDWLDNFMVNCTVYSATIYPRGQTICGTTTPACGFITGSLAIKSYSITGMETESEAAVIEEITFDMYAVTTP
uniref:Uncharacterized protein n=1 Tax=viral metagenome TaxID=1070528 RepID=A0A6M3M8H2_9ZZZZ